MTYYTILQLQEKIQTSFKGKKYIQNRVLSKKYVS